MFWVVTHHLFPTSLCAWSVNTFRCFICPQILTIGFCLSLYPKHTSDVGDGKIPGSQNEFCRLRLIPLFERIICLMATEGLGSGTAWSYQHLTQIATVASHGGFYWVTAESLLNFMTVKMFLPRDFWRCWNVTQVWQQALGVLAISTCFRSVLCNSFTVFIVRSTYLYSTYLF